MILVSGVTVLLRLYSMVSRPGWRQLTVPQIEWARLWKADASKELAAVILNGCHPFMYTRLARLCLRAPSLLILTQGGPVRELPVHACLRFSLEPNAREKNQPWHPACAPCRRYNCQPTTRALCSSQH
jgi:hypothetical protein